MNGEGMERINVEQFQGHVLAELRTIGREIHDLKSEQRRQGEAIAAFGVGCAEKRGELERRVDNGIKKATMKTALATVGICVGAFGGVGALLYYLLRAP